VGALAEGAAMETKEPSDEDACLTEEDAPEQQEPPAEEDREQPPKGRRVVRVCDRDWGFLALASPWAWTRGVGDG
jgi:hypothetical protein